MAIKNLGRVVGLSAYEIWLAQGNDGTEEDFLATLKGEIGPQGEQGPEGRGAQADWSQNDKNSDSYIKNRPFYANTYIDEDYSEETVILEEAERTFTCIDSELSIYRYDFTDEEKTIVTSLNNKSGIYRLTVDGEIFDMPVSFGEGQFTEGEWHSISFDVNEDGSSYGDFNVGYNKITTQFSPVNEISLTFIPVVEEVVKIDEKYLPDTIATKEYVDQAIAEAIANLNL